MLSSVTDRVLRAFGLQRISHNTNAVLAVPPPRIGGRKTGPKADAIWSPMPDKPPVCRENGVRVLTRYNFRDMSVGESRFVPQVTKNGVRSSIQYVAKRYDRKFRTRSVEEGGVRGLRVYRVQ